MPLSLKALIGSHSLQEFTCYGTLIPMLTPILGQDIDSVGQATADVGKTNKIWEQV